MLTSPLAWFSKLKKENLFTILFILSGCASTEEAPRPSGPIAPPPGVEQARKDRAAVDQLLGQIPAEQYDGEVSVPVDTTEQDEAERRRREFRASRTDSEIVGSTHATDESNSRKLGDLDRQLGLQSEEGSAQAPSFTLGTQRIKELFKEKKYEQALIETNNLLVHYPKSPQLLTMKGTIHQRLGHIDLALTAYQRAFEYEPSRKLQAQIEHLKRLVAEREGLRRPREGVVAPGGNAEIKSVQPKKNASTEEQ